MRCYWSLAVVQSEPVKPKLRKVVSRAIGRWRPRRSEVELAKNPKATALAGLIICTAEPDEIAEQRYHRIAVTSLGAVEHVG